MAAVPQYQSMSDGPSRPVVVWRKGVKNIAKYKIAIVGISLRNHWCSAEAKAADMVLVWADERARWKHSKVD